MQVDFEAAGCVEYARMAEQKRQIAMKHAKRLAKEEQRALKEEEKKRQVWQGEECDGRMGWQDWGEIPGWGGLLDGGVRWQVGGTVRDDG